RCWLCRDKGRDGVSGGVFKCSLQACGRFYHRACVELDPKA
ncbi:unnamed protein product, partial [Discosporangium mesarthrocarpum]